MQLKHSKHRENAEQRHGATSPFLACLTALLLLPLSYGVTRSYTFYFAQPIHILSQSSEQENLERVTPPSSEARFVLEVASPATH